MSTEGLTDAEVAVADCLVTAFGRSQSVASDKHSTGSAAAEVHLANTSPVAEVSLEGSATSQVSEAGPALVSPSQTDEGALEVRLSGPVLERSVTYRVPADVTADVAADVNVTETVLDQTEVDPLALDVNVADRAVSGQCESDAARPNEGAESEPAPTISGDISKPTARYRCHICDKGFTRNGSLIDHLAAHAGTKAYACGECGERFQYRDGLLVHRRRHHGGGRLACPHCPVRFEKSCNLRRHLRVHSGERPFGCAFCPKRFTQSNGLKKHVRGVHADRIAPSAS